MTSALIIATVIVVAYSLWVRRHTWWSRWEASISLAIALEGAALLLMSPFASADLGPPLHRILGLWNVQQLLGHLCFVIAVAANIHHVMLRLTDQARVRPMFRRQVVVPAVLGAVLLVAVFVIADADFHADLFSHDGSNSWLAIYWVVFGALLTYLSGYAGRVVMIARVDPRAKETVDLYLVSTIFGLALCAVVASTALTSIDTSTVAWLCACLAVATFAYAAARSWRAKTAWFEPGNRSSRPSNPPRPAA